MIGRRLRRARRLAIRVALACMRPTRATLAVDAPLRSGVQNVFRLSIERTYGALNHCPNRHVMKLKVGFAAFVASILGLGACATKYEEPTSGDRARLRMVRTGPSANTSYHTSVKSAADSCFRSGADLAEQRIALLDNSLVRYENSLGMPGGDKSGGKRFSEAYIRAGQPFLLDTFIMGADIYKNYQCRIAALWTPVPGEDYEAMLEWTGRACRLAISRLVVDANDALSKRPADVRIIRTCEEPAT